MLELTASSLSPTKIRIGYLPHLQLSYGSPLPLVFCFRLQWPAETQCLPIIFPPMATPFGYMSGPLGDLQTIGEQLLWHNSPTPHKYACYRCTKQELHQFPFGRLALKVLVTTINAQWEGMGM